MGLDQKLELIEFIGSQMKRTVGTLVTHGEPRLSEDDHHFYESFSFYNTSSRLIYSWEGFLSFILFPVEGASHFWPGVLRSGCVPTPYCKSQNSTGDFCLYQRGKKGFAPL